MLEKREYLGWLIKPWVLRALRVLPKYIPVHRYTHTSTHTLARCNLFTRINVPVLCITCISCDFHSRALPRAQFPPSLFPIRRKPSKLFSTFAEKVSLWRQKLRSSPKYSESTAARIFADLGAWLSDNLAWNFSQSGAFPRSIATTIVVVWWIAVTKVSVQCKRTHRYVDTVCELRIKNVRHGRLTSVPALCPTYRTVEHSWPSRARRIQFC